MLFNSNEFLFTFLPLTAGVFLALGVMSHAWALRWLILASLVFYAWWRPVNVLIIAPSIIINFIAAQVLLRLNQGEEWKRASRIAPIAWDRLQCRISRLLQVYRLPHRHDQ
jgi:hypothetical protein